MTVLRRHVVSHEDFPPTAFAIYSGKLDRLASPLGRTRNQCHILSRLTAAEWVFQKGEPRLAERVESLAKAVHALPQTWSETGEEEIKTLLHIPERNSPLAEELLADVLDCCPPVHDLQKWSHGLVFVRWFLQRILAYPCFLWTGFQLAARLHLDVGRLDELLQRGTELCMKLADAEYRGILAEFDSPRWWRKAVEAHLWEATNGRSFDDNAVREYVSGIVGHDNVSGGYHPYSVIVLDSDLLPEHIVSSDQAVRVRPDDWPTFAEQPWIAIDLARDDPRMRGIVLPDDRERLGD
jgi:hypothetical protein